MRIKNTAFIALSLVIVGSVSTPAIAGDAKAGRVTAEQVCQTCHGMDGIGTMPMVANISGQQEEYIIGQIKDYISGKRKHEQMTIIVQMLDEEAIENVAAWYAGLKVTVEVPE